MAVHTGIRNLGESFNKAVAHSSNSGKLRHFFLSHFKRLCKTYDIGDILCSRSLAAFLTAAMDDTIDHNALFDIKNADTLGSVKLVTGKSEHINAELVEIDINVTDSLYRVGKHKRATLVGDLGYFSDGLDCAYFVISVHNRYYRGLLCYCGAKIVNGYHTILIYGEVCHGEAFLLQRLAGVKHGGMLDCRGYNMGLALLGKAASRALYSPVISLGAARCKIDLGWIASKNICYSSSRIGKDILCLIALSMGAGGIAPRFEKALLYFCRYLGINIRCSRVICINKSFHFTSFFSGIFIT